MIIKRICLACLLSSAIILFSACGLLAEPTVDPVVQSEEKISDTETIEQNDRVEDISSGIPGRPAIQTKWLQSDAMHLTQEAGTGVTVSRIPLDIPPGFENTLVAMNDKCDIYYSCTKPKPFAEFGYEAFSIECQHGSKGDHETIITLNADEIIECNGLFAAADKLFFFTRTERGTNLYCYDLSKKDQPIIVRNENGEAFSPIFLHSDGRFVTWYTHEPDYELYAYDAETDDLFKVSEGLSRVMWPDVCDATAVYVKDKSYMWSLEVYDLEHRTAEENYLIYHEIQPEGLQANENYVFFMDSSNAAGGKNPSLYCIERDTSKLYSLEFEDLRFYSSRYALCGSTLFITDTKYDRVIIAQLDKGTYQTLDGLPLSYCKVNSQGIFYSIDRNTNEIVLIEIEPE